MAGLVVTPPAVLGGTSKMVLRGIASISGNNEPLIVVDGVPIDNSRRETAANGGSRGSVVRNRSGIDYGNMAQDLDPSNIESVTVLRGANAAALYGSRASNGVVEIVTKSGRGALGGTTITASSNFVIESPLRLVKYQNAYGGGATDDGYNWVDGRGGGENDGVDESWGPPLNGRPFPQWWSNGVPQPWLPSPMNVREYFQTGHNLTTNFAISNATERSNVRFSALRMDATGMAPQNEAERTQLALNAGVEVTERFNIDGSFQYTQTQGHNRPSPGNGSYSAIHIFNWFQRQVDAQRMERATNEWDPASGVLTPNWNHNYHDNVYWLQFFRNNDDRRNRVIGQVTGNYQLAGDWLNARVRLGTDWFEQSNKEVYPFYSQDTPEGGFVEAASFRQETNLEALVTANRQLTSDLSLNVSGGANMRRNDFDLQEAGSRKLNVPDIYNVSNSAAPPLLNYIVQKKAVNSLYGLFTVGYREFAFIDVTARNDWSSTLPETSRSYFYPSFSGSLVFTDALQIDSDFLSYGKLRASWAKVGNDADPYQLTSVYSEVDKFGNIPGFTTSNTIPNANLRPEETRSWEIGTDLRFFFDRAALDLTYYNSTTRDQILAVDVSESSGYTRQVLNAGSVRNKGIEALLTVDLLNQPGGVCLGHVIELRRQRLRSAGTRPRPRVDRDRARRRHPGRGRGPARPPVRGVLRSDVEAGLCRQHHRRQQRAPDPRIVGDHRLLPARLDRRREEHAFLRLLHRQRPGRYPPGRPDLLRLLPSGLPDRRALRVGQPDTQRLGSGRNHGPRAGGVPRGDRRWSGEHGGGRTANARNPPRRRGHRLALRQQLHQAARSGDRLRPAAAGSGSPAGVAGSHNPRGPQPVAVDRGPPHRSGNRRDRGQHQRGEPRRHRIRAVSDATDLRDQHLRRALS